MRHTRQEARRRVLEDRDKVAHALIATVTREVPAYRSLAGSQIAEIEAIAGWACERLLQLWVEDQQLTAKDLQRFRGIGAARALDGRPLDAILRAYRVAATHLFEVIVTTVAADLRGDDIAAMFRLWMRSLDELSDAISAGHAAADTRLTSDRRRALTELLDDLLSGRHSTPAAITDRCQKLGLTLPEKPHLLVVEAQDPDVTIEESELVEMVTGLEMDKGTALFRSRQRRGTALLAPVPNDQLAQALIRHGWRGCLIRRSRLEDLSRGYRLAHGALDRAPEQAFRRAPLLSDGDAAVLALLASTRDADPHLVTSSILAELSAQPHLVDSLAAFLATGSAADAAIRLHVHPQTMRYRLRRISVLTEYDVRDPWNRFLLEVANTIATEG